MSPESYRFNVNEFLPRGLFDRITEVRVDSPEVIREEAARRRRRDRLTRDGKLTILAFDHPARGVLGAGSDPLILGNRHEYLGRVLRVAAHPDFDGVMGPPDILEDLFILNHLVRQGGGPSFLDDKVMVGCMQRGGVAGVAGEMDDRFTAYTAESIAAQNLDGGKMMFRFLPEDERTLKTIDYCARAVSELYRRGLFAFVEPLPQAVADGKYAVNASVPLLMKLVSVGAALGESSERTWLKIPYVEGYEQVALATTLPILMLGGDVLGDPTPLLRDCAAGMRARPNVRGMMVGRNVLYPGGDDPLAFALAVHRIVHQGLDADEAKQGMAADRGRDMDAVTRWVR